MLTAPWWVSLLESLTKLPLIVLDKKVMTEVWKKLPTIPKSILTLEV